jgi:phage shock protein E
MSSKRTRSPATTNTPRKAGSAGRPAPAGRGSAGSASTRRWVLLGSGLVVALMAVIAGWALISGQSGTGRSTLARGSDGTVVQANGGHWTNITPDRLAFMLETKDFTLLGVKTPYIGEIAGTDLYIPYTELTARATQLPADKGAKIVVYCRSGNESAVAAQTLIDLGYPNIENLDGGMNAWTASGRQIIQLNRG